MDGIEEIGEQWRSPPYQSPQTDGIPVVGWLERSIMKLFGVEFEVMLSLPVEEINMADTPDSYHRQFLLLSGLRQACYQTPNRNFKNRPFTSISSILSHPVFLTT